ncbi:MAG: hemolysin family protein, partial [Acidimicrobiia bacterium]
GHNHLTIEVFERDLPLILILLAAFLLSVFVAAVETALLRMPAVRVEALVSQGSQRAKRLSGLVRRLPEVLSSILLAALLSQIAAAAATGVLAYRWFGALGGTAALAVLTVVLYIYAGAIPKTYAVRHADRVALALVYPLAIMELVLRPITRVLVWIADLQIPGEGVVTSPSVTEDELRSLAEQAATAGQITSEDLQFIERVFRIGDRQADDIMVPRADIVAVDGTTSVAHALEVSLEAGHRRLPIFDGSVENITGMVLLRDLVRVPEAKRANLEVVRLADEPLVVPESKRVLDLLAEMQASGTHMAIVVDEYGGTAGLVTVEDIAEEVLGSISEDPTSAEMVKLGDGHWVIAGGLPVEDLEPVFGAALDDTEWNTAAGLVLGLLGRIPEVGDEVTYCDHVMRVKTVRGRRITRLEVTRRTGHLA